MKLQGQSLLGGKSSPSSGAAFCAVNPATGQPIDPQFHSASLQDVNAAAQLADHAFAMYGKLAGREKGALLRQIAAGLEAIADDLIWRAQIETALPEKRLQGELARTSNQLRLFAEVVEEGSWPMARIDAGDPARKPLPKPDVRSMLRPLGPVAVFGASNFPLAFSVAGGDTASALAAGNPVIVKAHPAHPSTSELVGRAISQCVHDSGLPSGVFSLLFDAGNEVGTALVQHPLVKAVGFTGSHSGGKALMQLAASRPNPIPCFAEMSSTNPLFILPGAVAERGGEIAAGLFESFTLGVGQFCTKPGIVFLPRGAGQAAFMAKLEQLVSQAPAGVMLNANIRSSYRTATAQRKRQSGVRVFVESTSTSATSGCFASPVLYEVDIEVWLQDQSLAAEIFGPTTLIVHYNDPAQLLEAARVLNGHLTATLHATEPDLPGIAGLVALLERKVGRLLLNGFPTGVEVCHAMVHGGPYPATSDGRSTSVGTQAIYRFTRPVCYQGFPRQALPNELQDENPLGILRMVNGEYTRAKIASY